MSKERERLRQLAEELDGMSHLQQPRYDELLERFCRDVTPGTILALLDENARLEKENVELRRAMADAIRGLAQEGLRVCREYMGDDYVDAALAADQEPGAGGEGAGE